MLNEIIVSVGTGAALLATAAGIADTGLTVEHIAIGSLSTAIVYLWKQQSGHYKSTIKKLEESDRLHRLSAAHYAECLEDRDCMREKIKKLESMVPESK